MKSIVLIIILSILSNFSSAEVFDKHYRKSKIYTPFGKMEIISKDQARGSKSYHVYLNSKEISPGHKYLSSEFVAYVEQRKIVVMAQYTGGNKCAADYILFDISDPTNVYRSDLFGTCSVLLDTKIIAGKIRMTFSKLSIDGEKPIYEYSNRSLIFANEEKGIEENNTSEQLFHREDSLLTIAGDLKIVTRELPNKTRKVVLLLDGKLIFSSNQYRYADIHSYHPDSQIAQTVVLRLIAKIDGCDSKLLLIEFDNNDAKYISPEFGNCNPVVFSSYNDNKVQLRFFVWGSSPGELWSYSKEQLTKIE
ncbi:MAG: hypothetical protein OEZ58_13770 [Gammaproteobacteria bacterium]|nr:hypothetical protein [Gammaproteobacteria bacterium]MDH5730057.1 hypothetical protein [Gammaproteobacteria bacterium]